MTLNEYQNRALATAIYPKQYKIIFPTLGLNGEAGEVAEKVKKVIRDNRSMFDDVRKKEIAKELGDVLWYIANLSNDIGYSLEEIAELNYEKVSSRKLREIIHGNGDNR